MYKKGRFARFARRRYPTRPGSFVSLDESSAATMHSLLSSHSSLARYIRSKGGDLDRFLRFFETITLAEDNDNKGLVGCCKFGGETERSLGFARCEHRTEQAVNPPSSFHGGLLENSRSYIVPTIAKQPNPRLPQTTLRCFATTTS